MGNCSTNTEDLAQISRKSKLVPSPSTFRDEYFIFIDFTSENILYTGIEDLLTLIQDFTISELSYFKITESDYIYKSRMMIQLKGGCVNKDRVNKTLLIEKIGNSILVQFGSSKVMDLMLDNGYIDLLYYKNITQKPSSLKYSQLIHFLYHFSRNKSTRLPGDHPVLSFLTSIYKDNN